MPEVKPLVASTLRAAHRACQRPTRKDRDHRATIRLAGMEVGIELDDVLAGTRGRRFDHGLGQRLSSERALHVRQTDRMWPGARQAKTSRLDCPAVHL